MSTANSEALRSHDKMIIALTHTETHYNYTCKPACALLYANNTRNQIFK